MRESRFTCIVSIHICKHRRPCALHRSLSVASILLRPQCPFSAKQYKALREEVYPAYKDKSFSVTMYHQVQPYVLAPTCMFIHQHTLTACTLSPPINSSVKSQPCTSEWGQYRQPAIATPSHAITYETYRQVVTSCAIQRIAPFLYMFPSQTAPQHKHATRSG